MGKGIPILYDGLGERDMTRAAEIPHSGIIGSYVFLIKRHVGNLDVVVFML